jgi:hypothetical protein
MEACREHNMADFEARFEMMKKNLSNLMAQRFAAAP